MSNPRHFSSLAATRVQQSTEERLPYLTKQLSRPVQNPIVGKAGVLQRMPETAKQRLKLNSDTATLTRNDNKEEREIANKRDAFLQKVQRLSDLRIVRAAFISF
ncbi:hypothetical protein M513_10437 [Trichuris suis]|uniref:Uncharacterized protein n=1 Tax=Trichuris suis TaxID=68888 RepID=A0A085LUT0_9BILA|nr:hypothetical protein M513_10437 [Trichuris suis]